ncbi:MAG: cyclic nucleotide-binding domain-containing protein [Candidatus Gastranaerophilales bacterium]|nr:cyclic nucleotide-binding domain-containing protein [Candidatus Gastranaerophilales bacterium]
MTKNFYSDKLSLQQISGIKFFSEFNKQDLDTLLNIIKFHKFNKGDHVTDRGDDSHKIYLIIEGAVKIYKKMYKGEEKLVGSFQDQQYFGEMAFLDGTNVVADTDLIIAELVWNEFYSIFNKKPEIIHQTYKNTVQSLNLKLKKTNSLHNKTNRSQNLTNTTLLLK